MSPMESYMIVLIKITVNLPNLAATINEKCVRIFESPKALCLQNMLTNKIKILSIIGCHLSRYTFYYYCTLKHGINLLVENRRLRIT